MIRCALYLRLSREDGEGESNSIQSQRMLLLQYMKEQEQMECVGEWIDDGISGSHYERPGFEPTVISGAEILSGQTALQNISLIPQFETSNDDSVLYVIPPHTLYGDYPPKIPESEVKDVSETGEIVLSRVVIPSGV